MRRIVRARELRHLTGLSKWTLWRMEKRGEFPKHVQLATNAVGWYADEVEAWIESRRAR